MSMDNTAGPTGTPGAPRTASPVESSTPQAQQPATGAAPPAAQQTPIGATPSTSAPPTDRPALGTDDTVRSDAMSALLAENWWAIAVRSVCAILFGILALFVPGATIASLVLLFAAYMLVDGIFGIMAAVRAARRHERWGLLVLEGIANIAAGVIAFLWPAITVVVFVLLLAAWALVSGGLMIGSAFRLNREHGRWWLVLGGVVSVIWGVLLFLAPIAGAVVLTWWLGAYALVFGAMLLGLAFRLRERRGAARTSPMATTDTPAAQASPAEPGSTGRTP